MPMIRGRRVAIVRDADADQDQRPASAPDDFRSWELLTVHDVAALLRVPVSWVYDHTRRGAHDALPVVKVGKYVRFRPSDLLEYVDRLHRTRR
jgi:excisionase family DNA binding protein